MSVTLHPSASRSIDVDNFGPDTAITTFTGIIFDLMNPDTWVFSLEDIAHSLSVITRFGGHTLFYSVAEHSIAVANKLPDPRTAMIGLLHDATEAYLGDVPTPQKRLMSVDGEPFAQFEESMMYLIMGAFGLIDGEFEERWKEVKSADYEVYLEERSQRPRVKSVSSGYWAMDPDTAKEAFISKYAALNKQMLNLPVAL